MESMMQKVKKVYLIENKLEDEEKGYKNNTKF